jgi:MFS family permease
MRTKVKGPIQKATLPLAPLMKPLSEISFQKKQLSKAWLVVALLCIVGCLNYLDRIMITTMRESIIGAIPMTDAQFGLLTSVFLWVYGILSPFAGFLADKFNRSRVIITSLFLWSIVTWLTAHATTYEELLATRALMGISEACYIPAALALIADYHKGNTRSLATGIHMGGVMVGQSLGFLGGWIAEKYRWSDAFNVFGIFGIIYCFFYYVIRYRKLKNYRRHQDQK